MSNSNDLIRVPIEFLAKINGKPKPFLKTWLLLKTKNTSSHYDSYSKQYPNIAKSINVSISTLRSHVKQMVYEGFATIENDRLRLVSKWRNPISHKTREYTKGHYGRLSKATINPYNLKLEVFQYQLKQQITRQNYRHNEKNGSFRKPTRQQQIKRQLVNNSFENGSTGTMREMVYNDASIEASKKDSTIDMLMKGHNLVCEAMSSYLALKEKRSISKASQLSLEKLSDITGYNSSTTLRYYRRALKKHSGLKEERDTCRMVFGKSFTLRYHFKDKFGNVFRKQPLRYEVGTMDVPNVINVRTGVVIYPVYSGQKLVNH